MTTTAEPLASGEADDSGGLSAPIAPAVPVPPPGRLAGGVAALLSGSAVVAVSRIFEGLGPLGSVPVLPLLGIGVATVTGAYLGPKVERRSRGEAVVLALVHGALVPALVAAALTLPAPIILPIAVGVSVVAWPLSMPSALAWLALLRLDAGRRRLERPRFVALAVLAAGLLIAWRYSAPLAIRSAAGETCISLPGESISSMAWSLKGTRLGFVSSSGYEATSIWLLDPATGAFERLARGAGVLGDFGIVVNDDGSIVYQADGATDAYSDGTNVELRTVSKGTEPVSLGRLPIIGEQALLDRLVGTPDGIAAVTWRDERAGPVAVWVRRTSAGIVLEPMRGSELADHPEMTVGIRVAMSGDRLPLPVALDGTIHEVDWPADATYDVSITPDHRWLVFQASRLTQAGDSIDELVAKSIVTGERRVVREGAAWQALVSGDYVARLGFPNSENRLCVSPLGAALT